MSQIISKEHRKATKKYWWKISKSIRRRIRKKQQYDHKNGL